MDPSQSWDRRGPALAVSALILLTAFALPAGSFGQTPRQRTNLDWSGYAVTARSPIRQIRGAWTEPSLTCRQRWSSSALGRPREFKKRSHLLERLVPRQGANSVPRKCMPSTL